MAKKKEVAAEVAATPAGTPEVAPIQPPAPKPPKIEANGVTRPTAGTKTGRVWEIADQLSAAKGGPADRKDVMAQGKAEGINESTVMTQFGRWREFHGLVNKRAAAAPAAAPVVEPVVESAE